MKILDLIKKERQLIEGDKQNITTFLDFWIDNIKNWRKFLAQVNFQPKIKER